MKWLWLLAALAYALVPIDLFPDLVPGWGWIDDLIVLALVYQLFFSKKARSNRTEDPGSATEGDGDDARRSGWQNRPGSASKTESDPYTVLGLAPGASSEEIQAAYRLQASRYHPDKVAHLGDEFRELAEAKFKKIQSAYDTLRNKSV